MELQLKSLGASLYQFLAGLSHRFGPTGEPNTDIVLAIAVISLLMLFFSLRSMSKGSRPIRREQDPEFGKNVLGRIEKLEMTLNSLRTEVNRSHHLTKGDLLFVKQEINELNRVVGREVNESLSVTQKDNSPMSEMPPGIDPPDQEEEPRPLGGGISHGLKKTREGLFGRIKSFFGARAQLDESAFEELEELLISSDLGVKTTAALLDELRGELKAGSGVDQEFLTSTLKLKMLEILEEGTQLNPELVPVKPAQGPFVVMVVGVNGVGKTTTVAKLANHWKESGHKVMVIAADTFRAAAVDQLQSWCAAIDVPVVSGNADAKPSTVVFEGMQRAIKENSDIVLIDTAGRLHNKSNLMQELEGVVNTVKRHQTEGPHEILLVVDGATGQNALSQAREFNQVSKLSGVVVTKLDGTPKGGVVVAIKNELGIPVRFIGIGEAKDDLKPFVAREFVDALFAVDQPKSIFSGAPSNIL